MQSQAPASSLSEPPPAASPQLGRWICQQGLRSARVCCLLLVLAAARVLLLLFCCCCFDDDCSCFFTFGHISYWYDNSRASYYCIYLLCPCMQSPAPATSSLAEPPPAASPQLGRWICQQGLHSAMIRALLLVLAGAAGTGAAACCCCCCFDDDCPRLFTFGHISYCGMTVLLLLRLHPHGIRVTLSVCLGTSS